jgi:predicted phage tail protein
MAIGLNVADSSTPGAITGGQTVLSFTTNTVTLTANVNATVNSGDTIVFSLPGGQGHSNIQKIAQARYQGLTNNVKMKTEKHGPHDHHSSGHRVKVTHEADGSITITSPYIAPGGARQNRNRKP